MNQYTYEFYFDDRSPIRFVIDLNRGSRASRGHAAWTRLSFHQCACCPLTEARSAYCPTAVDIEDVATAFRDIVSFTPTTVQVTTAERTYVKSCDVQSGLNSLLGLIMANSHCPILCQFKPMARFHLPFSSINETVYRVASAYLIRQYFHYQDRQSADWNLLGLDSLYEQLQQVNTDMVARVRAASQADANLNAVTTFFSLATIVSMTLRKKLDEMRPLFFGDCDEGVMTNGHVKSDLTDSDTT